ncbi:DNA polymerase III subunit delta' [Saccharibacter sp. 17.LH.SD]|uniref:DNA polymerase III subunit delta' n=1 Tax=Saccharibacter sp. 17.LH.SD TaxID=2689393 RepID=UPI0013700793|nr:DNA polymerase III subunit delta' [Saccharibacter sp. 17.LH.SD]MXV44555.1 DNA polymerase III subunit delta' [Saccharibacter sp. 17.LH.SD]
MTLPEPHQAPVIYGHQKEEAAFVEAWRAGRLHHAWLISGPAGIGKATLAYRLARIVLKGDVLSSATGRRISAGTHGDLLVIARQHDPKKGRLRGEITVSDVQPVHHLLHHTATEGGWRVVIVDGAEFLNRFAANALLKLLEEPPQQTLFLLTTAAPGALLPTLRSRCRAMALSPLTEEEMHQLLPDLPEEALKNAQGSPGRALFLAQDHHGRIESLVRQVLDGRELDEDLWHSLHQIARETAGFALFCDRLSNGFVQKAKDEASQGHVARAAFFAEKTASLETLRRQTESFSLDKEQAMRQALALASV